MRWRVILLTVTLTGCTVGPNFDRPDGVSLTARGVEAHDVASTTYSGPVDSAWWQSFGDPELTSLVERLAKQNLQLQTGIERILQARAQRTIAASQGRPRIDGQAKYVRERESYNGLTSLVESAPGAPAEFNLYQPQVQMSWELDLFGKVRRSVEAANARSDAALAARNGIALSAIGELAEDYLTLRQLQAQEVILRKDLSVTQRRLSLIQLRVADGVATTLDVAQAEAQASELFQSLPALHSQQSSMMNAIAQLLNLAPRALIGELDVVSTLPSVPPLVPVGLPADLLRRRPDILQAKSALHAATAETGVAVASFLPTISLGGFAGSESLHLASLFDWASSAFLIGPTLTIPFYQGGRLKGVLELRKAQQREAAILYRLTVLRAIHEIDNALTAYADVQHSSKNALATVRAEERALAAAENQYAQGVATQIDVVNAQSRLYRAEDARVRAEAQVQTSLVTLYRALGGGWDTEK